MLTQASLYYQDMKRFSKIALVSSLALGVSLAPAAIAFADDVPDQQVVNSLNWYSCLDSQNRVAQSFTPTRSGQLTQISLNPFSDHNPGPLIVDIFGSSNGTPSGSSLGTTSVAQNLIPDRNTELGGNPRPVTLITLSAPVTVTAGQRYFIVLSSPTAVVDMVNEIYNSYCLMKEQDVLSTEQSISGGTSSWGNLSDGDIDFATYITYSSDDPLASQSGLSNTGGNEEYLAGLSMALLGSGIWILRMVRRIRELSA